MKTLLILALMFSAAFALRLSQGHLDSTKAAPEHLVSGKLVKSKIAAALLGDNDISNLIKEGKSNTQSFSNKIASKTL